MSLSPSRQDCVLAKVYNRRRSAPRDAVYVGRGSPWGNPFIIGEHGTRSQVLAKFKCEVLPNLDLEELIGRDLVCWCWPKPCHADLILEEVETRYGTEFPPENAG